MKAKKIFFLIIILIPFTGSAKRLLGDSIPGNLLIEQKTNFYLRHLEQCWEVVDSGNARIDRLQKIVDKSKKTTRQAQIEAGISNRLSMALKDTLSAVSDTLATARKDLKKQRKRKVFWRKVALISDAVILVEVVYLYLKPRSWNLN